MTLVSGNISLGKIFGRLDQLPITFFCSFDCSSCFFTLFLYPEAFLKPSRAFSLSPQELLVSSLKMLKQIHCLVREWNKILSPMKEKMKML